MIKTIAHFIKVVRCVKCVLLTTCLLSFSTLVSAQVTLNILAVNGTEEPKKKTIKQFLPDGVKKEHVEDASGLKVEYDINEGLYYVYGDVTLEGKQTKSYQIKIKDIWQVDAAEISQIQQKIDEGHDLVEGTEFYETGKVRKQHLFQRLNDAIDRQQEHADNVELRIDRYRLYRAEVDKVLENAVSINFWRAKLPDPDEIGTIKFVIQLQNPSPDEERLVKPKHYLPTEVQPEHILDFQGFQMRFDPQKDKSFLTRELTLEPGEEQRYTIEILDIWRIPQIDIDNLYNRAQEAFKALELTEYVDSARYLYDIIIEQLGLIEKSQEQNLNINDHISLYRLNVKRLEKVRENIESLEALLKVSRQELKRSILENVLDKITQLKSISDIARSIFTKPELNTAWRLIALIILIVGIITLVTYVIWSRRSKNNELDEKKLEDDEK